MHENLYFEKFWKKKKEKKNANFDLLSALDMCVEKL